MRGEFIGVWSETWRESWLPLIDHEEAAEDVFSEPYRADPGRNGRAAGASSSNAAGH